jgi:hypothetical protein
MRLRGSPFDHVVPYAAPASWVTLLFEMTEKPELQ